MNEAEQILVIFLSGALAVFLVLGIITLTLIIQLLKSLKRIAVKAEDIGDKLEESVKAITGFKILGSALSVLNNITKGRRD